MEKPSKHFYDFGAFRIDVGDRQLLRDGEQVPLTPKVFDILLVLVENSGRTVGKDELMERVWADSFVEEGNLNRNVSTLRKILNDDALNPKFIRTAPKIGYSFVGEVRGVLEDEEAIVVENRTRYRLAVREEKERSFVPRLGRIGVATLVAGVIIVLALSWSWAPRNFASLVGLAEDRDNLEARDLYQRGRALWQTRAGEDLHQSTMLLEQAVKLDPNFALGRAALADAYAFDYTNWKKAEAEAREAARLDPSLAEPHASIGFVKLFWEWSIREAENEFKQAIQLNPNYATAHQWYAELLVATDRRHAAYAEMQRALELEPTSTAINAGMCQILYLLERFGEAEAQCKKTLELEPNSYNAHRDLYRIYSATGAFDEAVTHYLAAEKASGSSSSAENIDRLSSAYRASGMAGFKEAVIEVLSSGSQLPNYRLAQIYAELGDTEAALHALRQSYERHEFEFLKFYTDPVFKKLRGHARYEELIGRLLPTEE